MKNNLFVIAKSGWRYIAYALFAFVICSLLDLDFFAFLAIVVALFLVYLFRNPERVTLNSQQNTLVMPCDGIVTAIEKLEEDAVYGYRIDIDASYFNVGVLRMPMHSEVTSMKLVRGSRVAKNTKLFTLLNEYVELVFTDSAKNSIKVIHRLKQSFVPLTIELNIGEKLMPSSRYGFMANGVTSLYIPSNFSLNVQIGQEVLASQTVVGHFS